MRITSYYIWSIIFSVFYLVVLTVLLIILDTEARIAYAEVTPFEFVLLALAIWRATRLFTTDHITAWLREQLYDLKKVGRSYSLVQPANGPRQVLVDLFGCPWCLSLTIGLVLTFLFFVFEWFVFIILLLALSAVASSLQAVVKSIVTKAK